MPLGRFLAVLHARNIEFLRDRSALAWNVVLPLLLVLGMAIIFSGGERSPFEVGVLGTPPAPRHPFLSTPHVEFVALGDEAAAMKKLGRHQVDLLVRFDEDEGRYWVNPRSAKGELLERILAGTEGPRLIREVVTGRALRYVDWLAPGVLGMNMMFSCLFGVGFVVVRYRRNGFLKRLAATPLVAIEFVAAQIASRLLLIITITVGIFIGVDAAIDLPMEGGYGALFLVTVLGATAMISMGFVFASRIASEELAGGLLNLVSWPMMLLSGVWFTLDAAPAWLRHLADALPLTQLLAAARGIMIEGESLAGVADHLAALVVMSAVFLALGAWTFRWHRD